VRFRMEQFGENWHIRPIISDLLELSSHQILRVGIRECSLGDSTASTSSLSTWGLFRYYSLGGDDFRPGPRYLTHF